MTTEHKPLTFEEAIGHQMVLIRDIERSIRDSRAMGSDLMVRQYQHLKKQFIQQLNEMLKEQNMRMKMVEEEIA
jgi:hypothetical protein